MSGIGGMIGIARTFGIDLEGRGIRGRKRSRRNESGGFGFGFGNEQWSGRGGLWDGVMRVVEDYL